MTSEELDAYVAEVVAKAPPLTREQVDALVSILRPARSATRAA